MLHEPLCILKMQKLHVHKDSIVFPYLYMQENRALGRNNVSTGCIYKTCALLIQSAIVQRYMCRTFAGHLYIYIPACACSNTATVHTLQYMQCGKKDKCIYWCVYKFGKQLIELM